MHFKKIAGFHPCPQIFTMAGQLPLPHEELSKRTERKSRFAYEPDAEPEPKISIDQMHNLSEIATENKIEDEDLDFGIKGTCRKLEKEYFRLSGPPDPATIRPEEVLQKTLKMLKKKWKNKESDYAYICDQLRSIRQDMMVQRIKNEFAAEVYETHARIALESRDISHFNQCQTQLDDMYNSGIKGHNDEFLAYRILYTALHHMQIELSNILKRLTLKEKQTDCVQHSLKVVKALSENNYYMVFKLYKQAPYMGAYLIDLFIDRLRVLALQTIAIT
jgi:hypothetical protein